MQSRFLGILAAASLATPAAALDFGNSFSVKGVVELSYLSSGGGSDSSIGYGDVTLGWRSQAGGQIGYGFDLGIVAFADLDGGDTASAVWGGLVLTTSAGDITIGNPRPLLKTMFAPPSIGGARILDFELETFTGSLLEFTGLADDLTTYGISFQGTSGALTYGASYHRLDTENADIVELVGAYAVGNTVLKAGYETIRGGGMSLDKYLLGATYAVDRWSVGAVLSSFNLGMGDATGFRLYGDYAVTDKFKIGAQAITVDFGGSQTLYGLTGEYGFGSGGYARLGFADVSGSSDPFYTASVGFRF